METRGRLRAASPYGAALRATNLAWASTGNLTWLVESTNTYGTNSAAARSPGLQENQSSLLKMTVFGPGTVSFYWQTLAASDDFYVEFDIDCNYEDFISGETPWTQDSFEVSGAGAHSLVWNANTLNDYYGSSPTDAAFMDQFVFAPSGESLTPVTLANPAVTNGNFQFSFLSSANQTNVVQASTNLASGVWTNYMTISGDGTTKVVTIPANNLNRVFLRVTTQ